MRFCSIITIIPCREQCDGHHIVSDQLYAVSGPWGTLTQCSCGGGGGAERMSSLGLREEPDLSHGHTVFPPREGSWHWPSCSLALTLRGTSSPSLSSVQEKGPEQGPPHMNTHPHMYGRHGALSRAESRECPHTMQTLCMGSGNTVSLHSWHTSHTHVCLCTSTWPSTPVTSHTNTFTNAFETHIRVYVYIMMVSYLATSVPKTVKNPKAKQGPCQGNQIDVTIYTQWSSYNSLKKELLGVQSLLLTHTSTRCWQAGFLARAWLETEKFEERKEWRHR